MTTRPVAGAVVPQTNSRGCTYVLKATPNGAGTNVVKISKVGYVDGNHNPEPTGTAGVVAGSSTSIAFLYDRAATFTARLAGQLPAGRTEHVLPATLTTTFRNTYGTYPRSASSGAGTTTQGFRLYPVRHGLPGVRRRVPVRRPRSVAAVRRRRRHALDGRPQPRSDRPARRHGGGGRPDGDRHAGAR